MVAGTATIFLAIQGGHIASGLSSNKVLQLLRAHNISKQAIYATGMRGKPAVDTMTVAILLLETIASVELLKGLALLASDPFIGFIP